MRLLPRLARQARITEETAVPDTTTDTQTSTDVIMRFLTQGGAVVELYPETWTEHFPATPSRPAHASQHDGFGWTCLGCDTSGGGGRYGLGPRNYRESRPDESRTHANAHADACRAMPR